MHGNSDAAEILIKYGANINYVDFDKKNALIMAVLTGNQPLVQLLVEYGADLTITNEFGKTPYEIAVSL
jgi:ankyrin repeat protein